jgi:hypothetical protein
VLPVVLAATAPAWAGWDYAKLDRKLRNGEKPSMVIDLTKCVNASGASGPPVIAAPNFTTYNLTPRFIATSQTHPFEASNGAMLLEYVRLRLFPDNTADLSLKQLNPATYEAVGPATVLRCRLTDGSITVRDRRPAAD